MFAIFDLLIINSKKYFPLIKYLLIQVRVERKEPYKCDHSTINRQKIKSVVDERVRHVCYDCTLYPSFERFEDEYNVFVYSISTTYFENCITYNKNYLDFILVNFFSFIL